MFLSFSRLPFFPEQVKPTNANKWGSWQAQSAVCPDVANQRRSSKLCQKYWLWGRASLPHANRTRRSSDKPEEFSQSSPKGAGLLLQ
jgi:hypothetical protein